MHLLSPFSLNLPLYEHKKRPSYLSCYLSSTTKLNTKLKLRHMPIIPLLHMQIIHKYYENIKNVIHEWGYMYTFKNISAAFSHRLLKFILN